MIITEQYLTEAYARLNKQLFAGRLPVIPLKIVTARTFLGNVRSKLTRTPDGQQRHSDFVLQISRNFDLTELQLDSVIAHEMIHLFIMIHGLTDSGSHGEIFRAMMNSINREHRLNIEIKSGESATPRTDEPVRFRVVARMKLTNGQTALKVLPRVVPTIRKYVNSVKLSSQIKSIELFLSPNPFFARYPSSGAMKIYCIDAKILDSALSDAQPITQL